MIAKKPCRQASEVNHDIFGCKFSQGLPKGLTLALKRWLKLLHPSRPDAVLPLLHTIVMLQRAGPHVCQKSSRMICMEHAP